MLSYGLIKAKSVGVKLKYFCMMQGTGCIFTRETGTGCTWLPVGYSLQSSAVAACQPEGAIGQQVGAV